MKACLRNLINCSKFTSALIKIEKNTHAAVSENEKIRKVGLCFITGYFMKPFKITINHFFFNSSFCSQGFFLFRKLVRSAMFAFSYQVDARKGKGEIGNGKRLEMVNYNIHFKQSFGNKRIKKFFFTDKMCIHGT